MSRVHTLRSQTQTVSSNESRITSRDLFTLVRRNDPSLRRYLTPDNINQVEGTYGDTLLHCAIRSGHGDMVKILLKANINTSISNKDGFTAMDLGSSDTLQLLIDHDIAQSQQEVAILKRDYQDSERRYRSLKRDYDVLSETYQQHCEESQAQEKKWRDNVSDHTRLQKRVRQLETINKNLLKATKKS